MCLEAEVLCVGVGVRVGVRVGEGEHGDLEAPGVMQSGEFLTY